MIFSPGNIVSLVTGHAPSNVTNVERLDLLIKCGELLTIISIENDVELEGASRAIVLWGELFVSVVLTKYDELVA